MAKPPPVRRSAASRLRDLADRLDPRQKTMSGRPSAPLVRFGGRWWHRDELVAPTVSHEPPDDIELGP